MNGFLIPANSKKSMLIFGLFKPFDLILFGSGVGITLLMLMILPLEDLTITIIALSPALITAFLVFPVAYYHNVLSILIDIFNFYTERQKFIWRGWCVSDGTKERIEAKTTKK